MKENLIESKEEWDLPETLYVRDIETKVFQAVILQCLAKIDGISLIEGNFLDHILGREESECVRGIVVEQDNKRKSLVIKVEINVRYGVSIPNKSKEIQEKIIKDIVEMTGLHVASIHIIFKNLIIENSNDKVKNDLGSKLPLVYEEDDLDDNGYSEDL